MSTGVFQKSYTNVCVGMNGTYPREDGPAWGNRVQVTQFVVECTHKSIKKKFFINKVTRTRESFGLVVGR